MLNEKEEQNIEKGRVDNENNMENRGRGEKIQDVLDKCMRGTLSFPHLLQTNIGL